MASDLQEEYFRFAVQLLGRLALPLNHVEEIVRSTGKGKASEAKYVKAFNLCDGKRPQKEVATLSKLDQGNLSRVLSRWEQHGVVFRVGDNFLHVYMIPEGKKERQQ